MNRCRILNESVGSAFNDAIDLTYNEDQVERSFALCEMPNGAIIPGATCVGNECTVKANPCRIKGSKTVGYYHTHPDIYIASDWSREQVFSWSDVNLGLERGYRHVCLGYRKPKTEFNTLRCIDLPKKHTPFWDELLNTAALLAARERRSMWGYSDREEEKEISKATQETAKIPNQCVEVIDPFG
jgi:hypothetical protein